MNIINAVNQLIFRLKPKPENGGKSKAFYPNEKDLIAINSIMEFVEKSLLDNEKNKDIRLQKLYLILFNIYLKEFECPVATEKMINDKFNKPLSFHLFKTRSMLDAFYIDNITQKYKQDFDLMKDIKNLKFQIIDEKDKDKLKSLNEIIINKKSLLKNMPEIDKEILEMELSTQEVINAIKLNMNNLFTLTNN